jgi:hypothetical protein
MAQPLRSLPPQIKNAPLVVPTRSVKFVRVEVIKVSLLIRTTTVLWRAAHGCDEVLRQPTNHIILVLHGRTRVDLTREQRHATRHQAQQGGRI